MPKVSKSKQKKIDPPAQPTSTPGEAPPAALDPKAAEKAFQKYEARMLGLDAKRLASLSVDLEMASMAIAGVGRWIKTKEPRARFAALPAKYFDQAHVEDLEGVALAAWHASLAARSVAAGKSEAKLPVSLVQKATALRQRMQELCEYHFGADPADGPEIADIKLGNGYSDLAGDLLRLAKLYAKHRDRVKLDPKNYRASDEEDAGRVAHEIFRALGEGKNQEQKTWTDRVQRAFTLLVTVYGEVSAAGAWLWRDEDPSAHFPSLYVVGRPAAARAPSRPQDGGTGEPAAPPGQGTG